MAIVSLLKLPSKELSKVCLYWHTDGGKTKAAAEALAIRSQNSNGLVVILWLKLGLEFRALPLFTL